MQFMEAEVIDSTHLRVLSPIKLIPGSKIKITVEHQKDIFDEQKAWFDLSMKNFESAFGDDEPEYLQEMIKKINKDFIS